MATEKARILKSFDPLEFDTVDADKIPAGLVKIHVRDAGEFYAPGAILKTHDEDQGHAEFPEEVRGVFRRFMRVFAGCYDQTLEGWESGFRADAHPWGEIAYWEWLADTMDRLAGHLTGDDAMTRQKRKDIYGVISLVPNMIADQREAFKKGRLRPGPHGTVTASRASEIIKSVQANPPARGRREHYRRLIQGDAPVGPNPVPIAALFHPSTGINKDADFVPEDLIAAADAIIGVDVDSRHEFLVYGRALMEKIVREGESAGVRVQYVELDQDSDELEQLIGLVEAIKGSHDYPGGSTA